MANPEPLSACLEQLADDLDDISRRGCVMNAEAIGVIARMVRVFSVDSQVLEFKLAEAQFDPDTEVRNEPERGSSCVVLAFPRKVVASRTPTDAA